MLYIWLEAIETPVIARPDGALACQLARVPALTLFGPVMTLIPGGVLVPGGQDSSVLRPTAAAC